jgi:hypothetical protein
MAEGNVLFSVGLILGWLGISGEEGENRKELLITQVNDLIQAYQNYATKYHTVDDYFSSKTCN